MLGICGGTATTPNPPPAKSGEREVIERRSCLNLNSSRFWLASVSAGTAPSQLRSLCSQASRLQDAKRIFASREPAVGGEVILLQRGSLATTHAGAHFRSKRKSSAETCIKISVTESLLQRGERWLARAVARRDTFDL